MTLSRTLSRKNGMNRALFLHERRSLSTFGNAGQPSYGFLPHFFRETGGRMILKASVVSL